MSADRRTAAWAAKYSELLQAFTDALGGDNIPPAKLAICRTIATLQTELSVLGDQFANGAVGADDLNKYIKISATVGTLLQSIGLDQVLQKPPVDQSRGGDAHEKLMEIFDKIVAARVFEESKGVFRNRNGDVLDNTNHVEGCECEPCHWRRGVGDVEAAEAAEWRNKFIGRAIEPPRHREPVVVASKAEPPPPPALTIVAGTDAVCPETKPADPPPPASGLEERRHTLTGQRNELERERGRLAEEALTNPAVRARLNEIIGCQAALDAELRTIDIAIAKAAPDSTTTAFLQWSGMTDGMRFHDWSPASNPNWPRLR